MDTPRQPIGEVLPTVEIAPLPDGWLPLDAIVLVPCLTEDGVLLALRTTENLDPLKLIGALTGAIDKARAEYLQSWQSI